MPELPEVETIARDVDREVAGRTIVGVTVTKPDVLREVTPRALAPRVRGARIERAWRRAKHIVITLSTGEHLVIQPRFTGGLLVATDDTPPAELAYSTLAFALDDGRSLHYRDIRRLGTVALMPEARFQAYMGELGVEPLSDAFTDDALAALVARSGQPIKKVLMDQYKIVGVGNIYANEALWRAGIDPSRAARTLTRDHVVALRGHVVDVLREAIAQRGSSFRDYRDALGESGQYVDFLAAYGRGGLPCKRCGTRLTETHEIDGRQTVLCHRCQS